MWPDSTIEDSLANSATKALETMTIDTSIRMEQSLDASARSIKNPLHRKNSSSVRFNDLMTVMDLNRTGDSITASVRSDSLASGEDEDFSLSSSSRSKGVSLHIQVLQDARRRQKVEALRDAVLDQQIELWASALDEYGEPEAKVADEATISTSTLPKAASLPSGLSDKEHQLAMLSKMHSMDNVSEAVRLAILTELEVAEST